MNKKMQKYFTMLRIFIYLMILSFAHCLNAQPIYTWAKGIGSTDNDHSKSIYVNNNNVYITGCFQGTVDFNPDADTAYLTAAGDKDIFFAKYDTAGNYIWAKSVGSPYWDEGNDIIVDDSENIYVIGFFQSKTDFDPGPDTAYLTAVGEKDIFFAKYDNAGNYIWAKKIGSPYWDDSFSIKIDKNNYVYIIGHLWNINYLDSLSSVYKFPSSGIFLSRETNYDIFFSKYDSDGNNIWSKSIISNDYAYGTDIAIDNNSNVYVTGYFKGTIDVDPSIYTNFLFSEGGYDIIIAKYDSLGNYIWANSIGSSANDHSQSITVDSIGNIYIAGYFQGTADFDPGIGTSNLTSLGGTDIFFAKYNSLGERIWAECIGSIYDDHCYGIDIDKKGDVYLIGHFKGTVDFDPDYAHIVNLNPVGMEDVFFAKYNKSGKYLWANNIGSLYYGRGYSIKVDDINNVYITGSFHEIANFDPEQSETTLYSMGNYDIFFAKYSQYSDDTINISQRNEEKLFAYPNPTKGILCVDLGKTYNNIKVSIKNSFGQEINNIYFDNTNKLKFLLEGSSQIYFVTIFSDNTPIKIFKVLKY